MAIEYVKADEPKKSTAARKDVRSLDGYVPKRNGGATSAGSNPAAQVANDVAPEAGTQALPVKRILGGSPVANAERTGGYGEASKIAKLNAEFLGVTDGETSPLSKPKMGRPRTGYIKAEYNRQYMADLRTIKRLGLSVTVSEWRKTNGA